MSTDAARREQIRLSLLRHLDAAGRALAEDLLLAMLRSEGLGSLAKDQLQVELSYLEDKAFVARVTKPISPEMKLWRITAAGRDHWAEIND